MRGLEAATLPGFSPQQPLTFIKDRASPAAICQAVSPTSSQGLENFSGAVFDFQDFTSIKNKAFRFTVEVL